MEMSPKDPELYRIRHSLAHVLAQAVKAKFPHAQLGFGPPTDTGFFYDFDLGGSTLHENDLAEIEATMKRIIREGQVFARSEADAAAASSAMEASGEHYKVENVRLLAGRGEKVFSFYKNGTFVDLCEGPHVESTRQLPADGFRLDRIAGAYWLGSEKNKMLTRIYALAFKSRDELKAYLQRREQAERFDHRLLGKELGLYAIDDLIGKGLPLWLPNGTAIRDEIEKFAREKEFLYGYKRVVTPHLAKADLYHTSGHLPSYLSSMFPPMKYEDEGTTTEYYLKPMNCPHHHLIYRTEMRSYRDLPLRLAEYGTVYRHEQSGELSGLIRVRAMAMNDAHIYCSRAQLPAEFRSIIQMYQEFYSTFRLRDFTYRLSVRGDEPSEKFQGDPQMWDEAEALLRGLMDDLKIPYFLGTGEAAFYGPKIDIQFKSLLGREETVSTIQVDFLSPKNFNLTFINEQGQEEMPIILHRAPLSTHERFLSFLTEYYGGAFPTWCAAVQVAIVPVSADHLEYAKSLGAELHAKFVRVEVDDSSNTLNKKIRTHTTRKVPITLVVGGKEVADNTVTVRRYGVKDQVTQTWAEFQSQLHDEILTRRMDREPLSSII